MNMPGEEYIAATMRSCVSGFAMIAARELAGDQAEVELARLEQRHVLGAALGVARLDAQARLLRVQHFGEGGAVHRETAARGGGAEDQAEGGDDGLHGYCGSMLAARTILR